MQEKAMFCSSISLDESRQLLVKRDEINIRELKVKNANTKSQEESYKLHGCDSSMGLEITALGDLHSATVITDYCIIISRLLPVTQVKGGKELDKGIWVVSQSSWSSKPSEI